MTKEEEDRIATIEQIKLYTEAMMQGQYTTGGGAPPLTAFPFAQLSVPLYGTMTAPTTVGSTFGLGGTATVATTKKIPAGVEYKPWDMFGAALDLIDGPNILARGGPGTGKNQRLIRTFKKQGIEHGILNMTAQTSKEDAYGHFVPNEKGSMSWIYNAAAECAMKGIPLLINEIDKCVMNGESQDILQTVCETFGSWEIMLPDGKNTIIRPKKGFRVIGVMNGTWDDLPIPILTRFPIKIDLGESVDPEAVKKLPSWCVGLVDAMLQNKAIFNLRSIFAFKNAVETMGKEHIRMASYLFFGPEFGHGIADSVLMNFARSQEDLQMSHVDSPEEIAEKEESA